MAQLFLVRRFYALHFMTSNNLFELRSFLEQIGAEDRTNLQRVIGGGFTNSPEHLCDHIQYLRASFFVLLTSFQMTSRRQFAAKLAPVSGG